MPETQIAATGWEEAQGANLRPAPASQRRGHRSDVQLAHAAGRGDTSAFDALYQRHHLPLLAFARHMLGRRHDAEDVVQHTFLAADRAFRAGKVPNAVRAWLYTVARNRCVSVLRARRDEVALAEDGSVSTDGLAAEVEQREELRALAADVRRLPDDQRAALLLAELGELSHVEVARVIGVRQGKVKALVFQAREALAAASHARSLPCRAIREELSVATGAGLRRRHLRDHLVQCDGCREFSAQVRAQRKALAILLPVVPSAGLHEAIVAGAAGASAAGAASAGALSAGAVAAKLLTIAAVGGAVAGGGALGLTGLNPGGGGDGDRPAVARVAPPAPRAAEPSVVSTAVTEAVARGGGMPGAAGDRAAKAPGRRARARRSPAEIPSAERRATRHGRTGSPGHEIAPRQAGDPQGKTPPGQAKQGKTPPGQASQPQAKTPPGQTRTPPGQTKPPQGTTPPGQTRTPPGQTKPAQDKAAPGQTGTPPGQSDREAPSVPPAQVKPQSAPAAKATPGTPAAGAPAQAKQPAAEPPVAAAPAAPVADPPRTNGHTE